MERITPEQVVEAYKATGLKPMRGKWFDGNGCACGISAICATVQELDYEHPEQWADAVYGVSYVAGFVDGFDGTPKYSGSDEGYTDGQAAWKAVVEAGLVEGDNA